MTDPYMSAIRDHYVNDRITLEEFEYRVAEHLEHGEHWIKGSGFSNPIWFFQDESVYLESTDKPDRD